MVGYRNFAIVAAALTATAVAAVGKAPTDADLKRITAAVPDRATVKPAGPRKLLVFSLCRSYRHASIPCGIKAVEAMAEKTGAFEAVVSDDISMFEPRNIKRFDAILMNNCTGELFLPPNWKKLPPDQKSAARERNGRLQKSLLDFVSGGKGLIVIHGGLWCFLETGRGRYADLVGAKFVAHPWHTKVNVKLDDPGHPLCAAFGAKGFAIRDEIYTFTAPYSRQKQRVLYSLDTGGMKLKDNFKGRRGDGDYALGWIKTCGKGRVFYSAFGHDFHVFWTPAILRHWLDGIQYALGDLKADATPRPPPRAGRATGKIVLIAGPNSHRKGEHDHEEGVALLKQCLDAAGKDKGIGTRVVLKSWPRDPGILDDAGTILIYADGGNRHPLAATDRLEKIRGLMARGVGLVLIHYAVMPPRGAEADFLAWTGGYYQSGYSKNPLNTVKVSPATPSHPICRGWKAFTARDEFYYRIRFGAGDGRVAAIMTAGLPGNKPNREVLAWAVQRADGGRGFGFTGAHFHRNWRIEPFRKMVLNAIWWTAKMDVPSDGVHDHLGDAGPGGK